MKLAIYALSTLLPAMGFGSEVIGTLYFKGENRQALLKPVNEDGYFQIKTNNEEVDYDLSQLFSGDQITGEGEFLKTEGVVNLHRINSVGIKRLLGLWRAEDDSKFHFMSAEDLQITYASGAKTVWTYALTPEAGNKWAIQMENDQNVVIGLLRYFSTAEQTRIVIDVQSPRDGRVLYEIKLKPIPPEL